jgi:N-acetylglucosamine-6-phosphate deacetylase
VLLSADRVLLPSGIAEPGWVQIAGETITGAGGDSPPAPADRHLPATVVAGFVDIHCHGGGGAVFTSGDGEAARTVLAMHRSHGTTSLMASLVSDSVDQLGHTIAALAPLVAEGELIGIHLEGPWLSAQHRGAHDRGVLRAPQPADIDRLLDAGMGAVRMVTLAPELDGGLDAVRRLRQRGVVVALGHSDARYTVARQALDAGITVGTHLFNAMRPVHHREPGPILALLDDERAVVELIADGIHLRPEILAWAARSAPGRFVLVTDAMAAAGGVDGDYRLGRLRVEVREGVARLVEGGAIAGSTLTMDAALRYAVQQAGIPFEDAVRAATRTPAQVHGLGDVGSIEPGRRADLVVLDDALEVDAVMRLGSWLTGGV